VDSDCRKLQIAVERLVATAHPKRIINYFLFTRPSDHNTFAVLSGQYQDGSPSLLLRVHPGKNQRQTASNSVAAAYRIGMQMGIDRNAKWPHRPSQLKQFHGRSGCEGLHHTSRHRVDMGDRVS